MAGRASRRRLFAEIRTFLAIVLVGLASHASAQTRFDVVASDAVGGASGLTVYTIRDAGAATCFTLFVYDDRGAVADALLDQPPPPLSADQAEKVYLADTLRELRAERDRQLLDLQARSGSAWPMNYEMAREDIELDFERSVGALLPGVYPSAQVAPGLPTTSRLELDAAVRRAIAEGDAVSASQAPLDQRLLALLERLGASRSSRMAVSGPTPCSPVR